MKRILAVSFMLVCMLAMAVTVLAAGKTEVVPMRTEHAKVFKNDNGTYTAEIKNHPVHKKNARGEWIDISPTEKGVAKVAYEIDADTYDSYCCDYSNADIVVGGDWVGCPWGGGLPENRTAYLWYTAGLPSSMIITTATYDVNITAYDPYYPIGHIIDGMNIGTLSYNPRWLDDSEYQTFWNDCTANILQEIPFSNATSSGGVLTIELNEDLRDSLVNSITSQGFFALGHSWPNGSEGGTKQFFFYRIGNSSTLWITFDLPRKIVPTSESSVEKVAVMPNPFNPATTISFQLTKVTNVVMDIYSINGQKVDTLINGTMQSGLHSVKFDGTRHASGVYFYKISTPNGVKTGKMHLLK